MWPFNIEVQLVFSATWYYKDQKKRVLQARNCYANNYQQNITTLLLEILNSLKNITHNQLSINKGQHC
jgi:hypothetical protein